MPIEVTKGFSRKSSDDILFSTKQLFSYSVIVYNPESKEGFMMRVWDQSHNGVGHVLRDDLEDFIGPDPENVKKMRAVLVRSKIHDMHENGAEYFNEINLKIENEIVVPERCGEWNISFDTKTRDLNITDRSGKTFYDQRLFEEPAKINKGSWADSVSKTVIYDEKEIKKLRNALAGTLIFIEKNTGKYNSLSTDNPLESPKKLYEQMLKYFDIAKDINNIRFEEKYKEELAGICRKIMSKSVQASDSPDKTNWFSNEEMESPERLYKIEKFNGYIKGDPKLLLFELIRKDAKVLLRLAASDQKKFGESFGNCADQIYYHAANLIKNSYNKNFEAARI